MKDTTKIAVIIAALLSVAAGMAWAGSAGMFSAKAGEGLCIYVFGPAFMLLWFALLVDGIAFTLSLDPAPTLSETLLSEIEAMMAEDAEQDAKSAGHLLPGGEMQEQEEEETLFFELKI